MSSQGDACKTGIVSPAAIMAMPTEFTISFSQVECEQSRQQISEIAPQSDNQGASITLCDL